MPVASETEMVNLLKKYAPVYAGGTEVDPVSGNAKQFLLSGIGDTYTVTATKTGYTTEAKQIKNTGDQTFKIVMKATA